MNDTDLYAILGVPPTATAEEIRAAWMKLALEHHPDRGGDETRMKRINGAYHVLKDPSGRADYDRVRAAQHRTPAKPSASHASASTAGPVKSAPRARRRQQPAGGLPIPPRAVARRAKTMPSSTAAGSLWQTLFWTGVGIAAADYLLKNDFDDRTGTYRGADGRFKSGRYQK